MVVEKVGEERGEWRAFRVSAEAGRLEVSSRMGARVRAAASRALVTGLALAAALMVVMSADVVHDAVAGTGRLGFRIGGALAVGALVSLSMLLARGLPDRRWVADARRAVLSIREPGPGDGAWFEIPFADIEAVAACRERGTGRIELVLRGGERLPLGLSVGGWAEVCALGERLAALSGRAFCVAGDGGRDA